MDKDRTFKITEIVDLDKTSFYSLVNLDLKEVGAVIIKDGEIKMNLNNGENTSFNDDYESLLRYVKRNGLCFVKLDEESRWEEFNPNPLGKKVDDCSIRSYCAAKGIEWDTAFDYACEIAEKEKDIINSGTVCHKVVTEKLGMKLNKESKKVKPKDRITVMEWACLHNSGTYILDCGKHYCTVSEGKYYDSWNSGKQKVKAFYEFPDESYVPEE
ncbi:MAG: hypothetical protein J1F35_05860 [Erysipelotrichales bacterium]|nr:hypothetical protein [Erysipelotrichales bacterium]